MVLSEDAGRVGLRAYLKLDREDIWQAADRSLTLRLLHGTAVVTAVLALVLLDILLLKTLLERERAGLSGALLLALGEVLERQGEVEEALHLRCHALAVLAGRGGLQFAVVGLVDDAVARVLAAYLGAFAVAIALMELLGEELEELVSILLLGCDKILERLLLADPET